MDENDAKVKVNVYMDDSANVKTVIDELPLPPEGGEEYVDQDQVMQIH